MSKTSTLSLAVTVNGDGLAGATYIPPQSPVINANAPEGVPVAVALSSGANTLSVPAGALHAVVSPSTTSTNVKHLKTTSGDVGIPFTNQVAIIPVAGLSAVYCDATAAETIAVAWT